ncbi:MAG: MFS transporter, partial [Paludibacteraceae bacterium]|nr:MFS transporter [Paludibacteraceae bacterium]
MNNRKTLPWAWIPTLYMAEGAPYFAVNTLAMLFLSEMGLSNTDVALYTSWMYLPWVIKPFWSPILDLFGSKKMWVVVMQFIVAIALAGVAFTAPLDFCLNLSLAFFWLCAFASATHDIAADGLYILALDTNQQSFFVGIRNTFYRISTVL